MSMGDEKMTQEQIEKIVSSCEGLQFKEWKAVKKIIYMKFEALNGKNTLAVDENISRNIMNEINW